MSPPKFHQYAGTAPPLSVRRWLLEPALGAGSPRPLLCGYRHAHSALRWRGEYSPEKQKEGRATQCGLPSLPFMSVALCADADVGGSCQVRERVQ